MITCWAAVHVRHIVIIIHPEFEQQQEMNPILHIITVHQNEIHTKLHRCRPTVYCTCKKG